MTTKEPPLTDQGSAGIKHDYQFLGNSLLAQRQRLLNYRCVHGSYTTIKRRRFIDIMNSTVWVMEFKRQGNRVNDLIEVGKCHGVYLLASSEAKAYGGA